jgi:hypothetical protein
VFEAFKYEDSNMFAKFLSGNKEGAGEAPAPGAVVYI